MSGDVQPRRRRDKKKKKEEQIEETVVHQQPIPTPIITNDDTNIHVHKESSLGGGVCAKCIFFILMIGISIIIGITITEHRGQTDVDIPASESRFASIFEGWVDKSVDNHDDDEIHDHSDEVSHEESEEEEEEEEAAASEEEEETEVEESEQDEDEEEVTEEDDEETDEEDDEIDASEDVEEEQDDEEAGSEEVTEESQEDEEEQIDSDEEEPQQSEEDEVEAEGSEDDDIEAEASEEASDEQVNEDDVSNQVQSDEITEDISEEKNVIEERDDDDINEPEEESENDTNTDDNPEELTNAASIKSGAGNQAESESDDDKNVKRKQRSGAQAYEYENITNADDYLIRDSLDSAQRHLADNIQLALSIYSKTLEKHPNSPRALYGKAQALDRWADKKRSNDILQESIQSYIQVLNVNSTPDALFSTAAERCINRMRFIGNYGKAISIHKKLIERFPNDLKYRNDLAVTYLTINRIPEARSLLHDILKKWPKDGFALVHYGFILKTVDNDLDKAVNYLKKGIETREAGVIDGRFYFHLGDALTRLGRRDEAMKIYEDGVSNKVFLSKYQRSLYNIERLTGRPWWNKDQIRYATLFQQLEKNFRQIREEGLAVLSKKGYFKDESENLRDVGDWKQFELYARGIRHGENCKKCPITCKIIDSEPNVKSCRRGQVKFSVMHPGTHVWPHCGPTNCRLRIHLGLKVPPKTFIRVAEETRTWEEGKIFIFDDSFEHEVWHNGTEFRLVLIVDVWHPELTKSEKYNLSAI